MLRNTPRFLNELSKISKYQQLRTLYVLKRKYPTRLTKDKNYPVITPPFRVLEEVENTEAKGYPKKEVEIILQKFAEDIGGPGDLAKVTADKARLLILTKKAIYASPENKEKIGKTELDELAFSSIYAGTTKRKLENFILAVCVNKDVPWTLEKFHIRNAFRKAHVNVPDEAITMPQTPLTGPDMNIEGKEFITFVTINQKEKVPVRCRIHHWSTEEHERLPRVRDHWKFPVEAIYKEDEEIIKTLPELIPPVFDDENEPPPPRILKAKKYIPLFSAETESDSQQEPAPKL